MSFGWLGTFREGQWVGFRKFVLNERRDVENRIDCINAEVRRIGDIIVQYDTEETSEPTVDGKVQDVVRVTEKRVSVFVTTGSSVEKLVKAYVAQGGSVLDISMFLKPEAATFQDGLGNSEETDETAQNMKGMSRLYPHDGVVAPMTPDSFNPSGGIYTGGHLTWGKQTEGDLYGVPDSDLNSPLAIRIDHARRWVNQVIQTKRNKLEAQIIKLLDCREQLIKERDEVLVQAVGGSTSSSSTIPNDELFHTDMHLTAIVSSIDRIIWEETEIGGVNVNVKSDNRFDFPTILPDKPEDVNTEL